MSSFLNSLLQPKEDDQFGPEDLLVNQPEPIETLPIVEAPVQATPKAIPNLAPSSVTENVPDIESTPQPPKSVNAKNWQKYLDYEKELEDSKIEQRKLIEDAKAGLSRNNVGAIIADAMGGLGAAAASRYGGKVSYDPTSMGKNIRQLGQEAYKNAADQAKMTSEERQEQLKRFIELNKEKAVDPYTAERLALQRDEHFRKLDQGNARIGMSKEKMEELSDAEVKSITAFDQGDAIVKSIDDLFKTGKVNSNLGTYASKFENAKEYIPFAEADPEYVKMRMLTGTQLADYVQRISGAAVSEQEAERLRKNIPNVDDKPETFKVKLKEFKRILDENRKLSLDNIGKQKQGAEKYQVEPKTNAPKNKSVSEYVTVQAPDGTVAKVKKDQAQKYLDKGAKLVGE